MKKKNKFLQGFVSFVFSLLFIGGGTILGLALAATSGSFTPSGTVTFTSTDIVATVTNGSVTGGTMGSTPKTLTWTGTSTPSSTDTASWTGLAFIWTGKTITWTFTIKNNHEENVLTVKVGSWSKGTTVTNADMSVTLGSTSVSSSSGASTSLTKSGGSSNSVTVTVKFTVTDQNKGAKLSNWSIPITLSNG